MCEKEIDVINKTAKCLPVESVRLLNIATAASRDI
jgi:hypothetical protein